jgi:hypothetical protein
VVWPFVLWVALWVAICAKSALICLKPQIRQVSLLAIYLPLKKRPFDQINQFRIRWPGSLK